jgi:hypothetical protein
MLERKKQSGRRKTKGREGEKSRRRKKEGGRRVSEDFLNKYSYFYMYCVFYSKLITELSA